MWASTFSFFAIRLKSGRGVAKGRLGINISSSYSSTSMFINSVVQMFFMTNADEFSELIRTGNLDFALLKPIDTQFLISLRKVEWASVANFFVAAVLMAYALPRVEGFEITIWRVLAYV